MDEADQSNSDHPEVLTDDSNIFSDPESEWIIEKSTIINSEILESLVPSDTRPEDEQ